MDEETFEGSWYLIEGVKDSVEEYLFETQEWHEKDALLDDIDESIKELESWKKAVLEVSK